MPRPFVIAALTLPLLAIALGIAKSEYQFYQPEWRFLVRGYDPRDLLRGHFLSYTIDFEESSPGTCNTSSDCCLCLTRTGKSTRPRVERRTCIEAKSCDGFIATEHLDDLNRYYIPESKAQQYEELLMDARREKRAEIVLSIDRQGHPVVKQLEIGGVPIEQAR